MSKKTVMSKKTAMSKKAASSTRRRAAEITTDMFSGDDAKVSRAADAQWQQQPEELQQQLLEGLHLLSDIEQLAEDSDMQQALAELDEPPTESSIVRKRWPLALAASLIMTVTAGLLINWQGGDQQRSDIKRYVTRTGEQKVVQLEDGSSLTLNTASQVLVDFSDTQRRIVLDRGEAFFEVTKDATRPFTVQVDGRSVTALGTEFNIHSTADSFELAVIEGVVSIHHPDVTASTAAPLLSESTLAPKLLSGQFRVKAGTLVNYDLNRHSMQASDLGDLSAVHQWRTGMIGFNAVPLSEVVKELNRYSAKKILIEDASILDLKLYAGVRLDRLSLSLMGIEATLPVTVNTYVDRIVIVGREEN